MKLSQRCSRVFFRMRKGLFLKDRSENFSPPSMNYVKEDKSYNKFIWFYWEQGLDNAPEVVKLSLNTWIKLNPDYEVRVLSKENLEQYVGLDVFYLLSKSSVKLGKAGESDLIRLLLLYNHGGIWVDATTFCLKPLDSWLRGDCNGRYFFHFSQQESTYDRILVSWFMSSNKGNPELEKWLRYVYIYLFKKRKYKITVESQEFRFLCKLWGRKGTGFNYLSLMEKVGNVPYFWFFYIFNESKVTLYDGKYARSCAQMGENILETTLVSKQTYKQSYVNSSLYQARIGKLRELGCMLDD